MSLQPVMCWMAMFRLEVGEADIFVIDGSNLGPGGLSGELQRACRGREKTCNGKNLLTLRAATVPIHDCARKTHRKKKLWDFTHSVLRALLCLILEFFLSLC